jgi:hypothetical protein
MSDSEPRPKSKPVLKRTGGPPKPPTKTTLDLMGEGEPPREDSPMVQMVWAVTHATATWAELLSLNGGGRYEKRERLELSLDRNVILMAKVAPKMQGEDVQIIRRTLRDIRDYRRRFPRTDASNRAQADQAQRILDEIPKV